MLKVVLLDDNKEFLLTIKEFIEVENNAKCITFVNPVEAVDYLLNNNEVDIVLTDFQMPQLTGFEVAKKLVENNFSKRIVVFSGYDTFTLAQIRKQYNLEKKVEIIDKGDIDFLSNLCE